MQVPEDAYYGAQTQRAVGNFPISGQPMPPAFIKALARIKKYAGQVNLELGGLDSKRAEAINQAADEVIRGAHLEQFPVDVFQTGSGTSSNMNMNEVLAGRANEILGGPRGGREPVHPNDHVNQGQSSNDSVPTAIHLAALLEMEQKLKPALRGLWQSLAQKAEAFQGVVKTGRTHLQDAVPLSMGQVFSGYARQIQLGMVRIEAAQQGLYELPLGGTAVGTGINAQPSFAAKVIAGLAKETGMPLIEASNHFEAQAGKDACVMASGALKAIAVSLHKIANDIRFLASGPRFGLGELVLPTVQPGSSIMPGKVNPVICEAVIQASAQVMANDAAVMLGGAGGYFELNTMMPLIARNLLESIGLLAASAKTLAERCVDGLKVDEEHARSTVEGNLSLATFLAPAIGYDKAAALAHEAHQTGRNVRELALEKNLLPEDELERLLSNLTGEA